MIDLERGLVDILALELIAAHLRIDADCVDRTHFHDVGLLTGVLSAIFANRYCTCCAVLPFMKMWKFCRTVASEANPQVCRCKALFLMTIRSVL